MYLYLYSNLITESPITQRLLRIGLLNDDKTNSNNSTALTTTDSVTPTATTANIANNSTNTIDASNVICNDNNSSTTSDTINTTTLLSNNIVHSDNNTEAILLFVRLVGEPYCCLGKVAVLNCNFDRQPIVIHWRLTQYNELMNGTNNHTFKHLLQASPMSSAELNQTAA